MVIRIPGAFGGKRSSPAWVLSQPVAACLYDDRSWASGSGGLSAGSQQGVPHPAFDRAGISLDGAPRVHRSGIRKRAQAYRSPTL